MRGSELCCSAADCTAIFRKRGSGLSRDDLDQPAGNVSRRFADTAPAAFGHPGKDVVIRISVDGGPSLE